MYVSQMCPKSVTNCFASLSSSHVSCTKCIRFFLCIICNRRTGRSSCPAATGMRPRCVERRVRISFTAVFTSSRRREWLREGMATLPAVALSPARAVMYSASSAAVTSCRLGLRRPARFWSVAMTLYRHLPTRGKAWSMRVQIKGSMTRTLFCPWIWATIPWTSS